VPKVLASCKMADARHQLRLHPLSIGDSQLRNWTAFQLVVCKSALSPFLYTGKRTDIHWDKLS